MKISRTSSPQVPGYAAKAPRVGGTSGKGFASKLAAAQAKGVAKGTIGAEKPAQTRKTVALSDIGADLRTGKLTPQAAIDKVIERILDQQLGRKASTQVRVSIGAALRESIADDPLLAAKVRALTNA